MCVWRPEGSPAVFPRLLSAWVLEMGPFTGLELTRLAGQQPAGFCSLHLLRAGTLTLAAMPRLFLSLRLHGDHLADRAVSPALKASCLYMGVHTLPHPPYMCVHSPLSFIHVCTLSLILYTFVCEHSPSSSIHVCTLTHPLYTCVCTPSSSSL